MIAGIVLLVLACLIEPVWTFTVRRAMERSSADTSWSRK